MSETETRRTEMTQLEFLIDYFNKGKKLTSLHAHRHGIMDLPKRVCELVEIGYPVKRRPKKVKTRYGNGKVRVMEYGL